MTPALRWGAACLAALLACCCSKGGGDAALEQAPPAPPSLPGRLFAPDGTPAEVSADSAIVLYLWLPLPGHPGPESDLEAIAETGTAGNVAAFAVQTSPAARNSAQEQVNSLGIVLPVFLADSAAARCIPPGDLPVAVLFGPGGSTEVETGFGAVERLLSK